MFRARTVECQESVDVEGPDKHRAAGRQALRNVRSRGHLINDPPCLPSEWQPLDDARYATHVCSRNGTVMPRPSLPAATSQ